MVLSLYWRRAGIVIITILFGADVVLYARAGVGAIINVIVDIISAECLLPLRSSNDLDAPLYKSNLIKYCKHFSIQVRIGYATVLIL